MGEEYDRYEFWLNLLHDIGKVSPHFKGVYKYLRHRRSCPATKEFLKGIEALDKAILKGYKYIDGESDPQIRIQDQLAGD